MKKLQIYNTLNRKKEEFVPIDEKNIGMYVCGPTVYDKAHLGNAKTPVIFDILYRILSYIYGFDNVNYVSNITDVDDKILNKSAETGRSIRDITEETYNWYIKDMESLNVLPPKHRPRATSFILDMIKMVEQLVKSGNAYEVDGNVLFDVESMPDYGMLSKRPMKELIAGARVEVAEYKKNPADFTLWKPADLSKGEQGWDSPFGYGRPGWHLECSAMSSFYLGNSFDIHGGGNDLIFPHHENECAQSMCAHPDDSYAKYWVHSGMLMVNGEKMSKSLGNFYTVDEVLARFPAEALRLAFLTTHYHQPYNFTFEGLEQAKLTLDKFYNAMLKLKDINAKEISADERLVDALLDDLNTPLALSYIHEIVSYINKSSNKEEQERLKGLLIASAKLLGILWQDPVDWFQSGEDVSSIEDMIAKREEAKKNKDYALSDEIRNELSSRGIILEDSKTGTTWKKL